MKPDLSLVKIEHTNGESCNIDEEHLDSGIDSYSTKCSECKNDDGQIIKIIKKEPDSFDDCAVKYEPYEDQNNLHYCDVKEVKPDLNSCVVKIERPNDDSCYEHLNSRNSEITQEKK